ncbi:MAG: flagellar biosynthesis protein FlhF [Desulfobacteraceae bacterium 4572_19]|nr:MAG: flagellar biosynthesis protein FlhF [Desulfobacteraceae bacterium 4572_19]
MPIKTYKAKSLQEAITRIKEEMGPDAMILSTRRIPKGLLDPYGVDLFEVKAQSAEIQADAGKQKKNIPPAELKVLSEMKAKVLEGFGKLGSMHKGGKSEGSNLKSNNPKKVFEVVGEHFDLSKELSKSGNRTKEVKKQKSSIKSDKKGYFSVLSEPEVESREQKLSQSHKSQSNKNRAKVNQIRSEQLILDQLRPQHLRTEQLNSEYQDAEEQEYENQNTIQQAQIDDSIASDFAEKQLGLIQGDLASIKEMLFLNGQRTGIPTVLQNHPECINVYVKLIKAGISEQSAQMFLKKAWDDNGNKKIKNRKSSPEKVTKNVIRTILANIDVWDPFDDNMEKGVQIAAFTGPTGVGKTTTIAKLAAELSMKRKKTVGLISIDSYRIGALEQLKTYSSIMGLPCLPAFTCRDLQLALRKMEGLDIILIDTAGHSHLDETRMTELGKFIDGSHSISTHLVLSATIDKLDMKDATENFAVLNPKSYLFTKVDETKRCGTIIDQVINQKMPISFITNGQRVPEDIMTATKKNILELILR